MITDNRMTPLATFLGICLLAAVVLPAVVAADDDSRESRATTGADASPYLIGHWSLDDSFSDFTGGPAIATDNTEFIFLNPTGLTLTVEYASFSNQSEDNKVGIFCGCDRDHFRANGRVRYTMLGESQGAPPPPFNRTLCPSPHNDGTMKTIVFLKEDRDHEVVIGGALQSGYQSDLFSGGRTRSSLLAVPVTEVTKAEIQSIHKACNGYLGPP